MIDKYYEEIVRSEIKAINVQTGYTLFLLFKAISFSQCMVLQYNGFYSVSVWKKVLLLLENRQCSLRKDLNYIGKKGKKKSSFLAKKDHAETLQEIK